MVSAIMLSVIMVSVIMLSVVIVRVVAPKTGLIHKSENTPKKLFFS
jgi:hypothetical protein